MYISESYLISGITAIGTADFCNSAFICCFPHSCEYKNELRGKKSSRFNKIEKNKPEQKNLANLRYMF